MFKQVTIARNAARSGGACYLFENGMSASLISVYNSILAENIATLQGVELVRCGYSAALAYNVLSSVVAWDGSSENNYRYDASKPLFTDAKNGDYTLAANSQAADKGLNRFVEPVYGDSLKTDLAGNPRISGAYVDLGAYERQAAASAAVAESEGALRFAAARIFDAPQATVLQDVSDVDAVSSASGFVASVRELSSFNVNAYGNYATTLPPACSLAKRAQTFAEGFDDAFEWESLERRDVEFDAFATAVLEANERANAVDPFEAAFAWAFDDEEEKEDSLFDF